MEHEKFLKVLLHIMANPCHVIFIKIFVLQILLGMLWLSDFKSC